jgi:hypothetical protein
VRRAALGPFGRARELGNSFRPSCGRDPGDQDLLVAAFRGVLAADFAGEK